MMVLREPQASPDAPEVRAPRKPMIYKTSASPTREKVILDPLQRPRFAFRTGFLQPPP
jgi:hypothetical protein